MRGHSHKTMSMVTTDYYYPYWEYIENFFVILGLKIAGMAGDLNAQP